jgi:hypothetical protein
VWLGEKTAARVLATLASSPATCALAPVLSPSPKLRHVVYASVLHFGVEKALLFNTTRGNIILGGSFFWMSIGVFVMYQMINFEI